MYPRGIIYQKGVSQNRGEIILKASLAVRFTYGLVRAMGAGLVGFVVIALVFTFGPIIKEEASYGFLRNEQQLLEQMESTKALETTQVQKEAQTLGLDSHYSLYIPKIDAKSKIIPNVDASSQDAYQKALADGVAHAKGTYFPGQGKLVYLFSHSTDSPLNFARYNAVFYLVRKLDEGDRVVIYFADQKYEYEVTQKVVTQATDVSWLTKDYDEETLVLQTCDPPGTTWNRLLVIAKRVD
jgi:LPXTG-site transpeptidase (sortase) family protein